MPLWRGGGRGALLLGSKISSKMKMSILRPKYENPIYFSLSLGCPIRLCLHAKIYFRSVDPEVNSLIFSKEGKQFM